MNKTRTAFLLIIPSLFFTLYFLSCQDDFFVQGKNLYAIHCQSCHMEDGTGLRGNIPPLAQSDYLKNNQDYLACIIMHGMTEPVSVNGKVYHTPMPAQEQLNEFQLTNIVNYINHAWGNDFGFKPHDYLKTQLEDCN